MGIAGTLHATAIRIRSLYGRGDRRGQYASLLLAARQAGYELVGLEEFHARVLTERDDWRVFALRHDVDVCDVEGNESFRAMEQAIGARATYYFRLTTAPAHAELIRRLLRSGFEVGYHYEEGATVAKRYGLEGRPALEARRDEITHLFRNNCIEFKRRWNPDLRSIASHGDWINGRLGVANTAFAPQELLTECGIGFEAYAEDFLGRFDVYVSDVGRYPALWANDYGPYDAIANGDRRICLLTHERRWHASIRIGIAADLNRARDGLRYRWVRRSRSAGGNRNAARP